MSHVRCIVLAGSVCVDCRVKHDGEKGCDLRSAHYALPVLLRATFVVADDVIAHEPPDPPVGRGGTRVPYSCGSVHGVKFRKSVALYGSSGGTSVTYNQT